MISEINTPPYEYQKPLFEESRKPSASAFRRISSSTMSMPSPPELLMDTSEDELDDDVIIFRKKSIPYKSPSHHLDQNEKSIIFQLNTDSAPTIISGGGLLWSLRQRVSKARSTKKIYKRSSIKPMKISIPKPNWSKSTYQHQHEAQPQPQPQPQQHSVPVEKKKKTSHASSGRPTRIKGPCQACQETSDGCMRKAFNWPFPTSEIYNDKGKPFVYLCNKCGLRYNKSGGCVCRNCRWVLCKEEKRKAMQLIEHMRRSRPNGYVDPEETIENFVCTPKYWNCGHPWKVEWILQSQHDTDEEDASLM